jgi:phosphoglycolate phosphatase
MKSRAVVFDLDGTIADTLADIGAAMNHVLEEEGLPVHALGDYRRFVGMGARELVHQAAGRFDERLLAAFRARYVDHLFDRTRPYPGIEELLADLARRGVPLAVLSNKPHRFTTRIVDALFSGLPFVAVFGEREGVPKKPDPTALLEIAGLFELAPSECVLVGDSEIDVQAARAASMRAIAVTWGFRDRAELLRAEPHAIADSVEELARAL